MKTKSLLTLFPALLIAFNSLGQGNPSTDGTFVAAGTTNLALRTNVSGTPTDRLLILNSNGNVGIATTSGSITEKLTITGNVLTSGNFTSTAGIYQAPANMIFRTNGTDRITIFNSTGNVGIGAVVSASQRLHVSGAILATTNIWAGAGIMGTNTGIDVSLRTNNTEAIVLKNTNSFVGIGTASASVTERLTVTGNVLTNGNISATGNLQTTSGILNVNHASNAFNIRLNATDRLTVLSSGNVGIGINIPTQKLHLSAGDFLFDDATPILYTGTGASELNRFLVLRNSSSTTSTSGLKAGGILIADNDSYANPGKNDLIVKGKVFIGQATTTNTNSYDLGVKGKIGAKDLQLETTSWADHVFADDYKLPSLLEVERYIRQNKRLSEVPSEEEVKANGYSVAELDVVLLKKVEELTLYIIEQQKQIEELKKKIEEKK